MKRRWVPFFSMFYALLVTWAFYLQHQLFSMGFSSFLQRMLGSASLAVPFFGFALLPYFYWRRTQGKVKRFQGGVKFSYWSLGFLSMLTFLVALRDLTFLGAMGVQLLSPASPLLLKLMQAYRVEVSAVLYLLALGLLLWAHWGSLRVPRVKKVRVPIVDLPREWEGFRIVQLSDLHIGEAIRKPFVDKVVKRVNELLPDLVAITGDSVDGTVPELETDFAALGNLKSKEGTFFITGNHEYFWGAEAWLEESKKVGMTVLLNSHRVFKRGQSALTLGGVPDVLGAQFSQSHHLDFKKTFEGSDPRNIRVLLSHQPKTALLAAEHGVHLQLSGHTHGGQFVPWTFFIRFFHPFWKGLHRHGKMWVYVSLGTGFWGPSLRLGAPSEITELILVRQEN